MTSGAVRRIVLCADDYAISAGVSRGIVELARMGRISATSAMSAAPGWPHLAQDLGEVEDRIAIGLHLTLTGLGPLGPMPVFAPSGRFPPLKQVVKAAVTGRLPGGEIAAEIERQLDAFVAARGRAPDFIDGHQHVHALPGVRGPLLASLVRRGWQGRLWLRDPADSPARILRRGGATAKAVVVAGLAAGFGAAARRAGFATNRGFSGFSTFEPAGDLASDFTRFLTAPGPAQLVMCHPGHVLPGDVLDEVVDSREREQAFLASGAFAALLARHRVELARTPG